MKAAKLPQKAMYGPRRKRSRSASAGMRSSLTSSLMPSAMVWSQPNFPPTRVGPRRSWMRPATLRSSQMKKTAEAATKTMRRLTDTKAARKLARFGLLARPSRMNRSVRPYTVGPFPRPKDRQAERFETLLYGGGAGAARKTGGWEKERGGHEREARAERDARRSPRRFL